MSDKLIDDTDKNIGKLQDRDLKEEMQSSYLEYAMSVIVSRALPDVRDGLKPVHRRALYAMNNMGLRSTAKFRKSAAVVGEVMAKYHPHGDTAIYDTIVRMAQNFSLRYPLVLGQGNFGSMDGDNAAAMRYCVTADTLIATEKGLLPIGKISKGKKEDISVSILSMDRKINKAEKWLNSGPHPTIRVTTDKGFSLQGSFNHPILTWTKDNQDKPIFKWKLLSHLKEGDIAVIDRAHDVLWPKNEISIRSYYPKHLKPRVQKKSLPVKLTAELAHIMGAILAEGTICENKIEFCNSDYLWIDLFVKYWKKVFPDCRLHIFEKQPSSYGKKNYKRIEIHSLYVIEFLRNMGLVPAKSAQKSIPELIFRSPKAVVSDFLRAYFEGDGSISSSSKMVELSLCSKSEIIISQMQTILLRFGIAGTKRFDNYKKIHKLYLRGLSNYRLFKDNINFQSPQKKRKLEKILELLSKDYSTTDYIPFLQSFIRANLDKDSSYGGCREIATKHNFDRYSNLNQKTGQVLTAVKPELSIEAKNLFRMLIENHYLFDPIVKIETAGIREVYSLKVSSSCHSFIGNGFVNHNTEAKMQKISDELLADIDKDTVDFVPNYDGTQKEPAVLPSRLPNLLLNGAEGIAVGMATKIAPHNLTEIINGVVCLIDNPDSNVEDLMEHVKGPDFPTGGTIYNINEIRNAYSTGKGAIVTRAVADIEEDNNGDNRIVISEIPYQVNKAGLITKIAELVKEKKIEGISDLRDESDRKSAVRIVVELKKGAYASKILNQLYKLTQMQITYHINMLAIVDGIQPRVLTLKMVFEEFVKHRKIVVQRRTEFELKKAKARAHILEGLLIALKNIDEVIETIKKSATKEIAKTNLIKKFKLSEIQAQAILDMRLQNLAGLERQKVEDEYKALLALIAELEAILASEKKILKIIKDELLEIKDKYGDERRTKVIKHELGKFSEEDLVPNEQVLVTLTKGNYIKRILESTYRAQGRGGKGIKGMETKEEDVVEHLVYTQNHENILFFTNQGRVFSSKVYEIPMATRTAKGSPIVNFIQLAPEEKVTAIVTLKDFNVGSFLFMTTKKGTVKKTAIKNFESVRRSGIISIGLDKGDELKWVKMTSGEDEVIMATALAQAIRFNEKEIRPMGRSARGVRGMRLRSGDEIVGMDIVIPKGELLVIMENGYGKRTELDQFTPIHRGGMGIKAGVVTVKTGKMIDVRVIQSTKDDMVVISQKGIVIRTAIKDISKIGRATQGVRIMKLAVNDKVSSVASVAESEDMGAEEEQKLV